MIFLLFALALACYPRRPVIDRLRAPRARRVRGGAGPPDPLALPATWDLLAAVLTAGLPVATAVRAVLPGVPPAPAEPLRRVADLLGFGADPVEAWAPALADPATASLARAARRSARSGAALASAVKDLAGTARVEADNRSEARAQRAAVLVAGPLALCFLPAFLCLGVAPVVIGLARDVATHW
ncbi:type II secretion system F family protein [Saccharothrix violaceirubra]|uniref:Pilus assembly protein TadC n=1 Tax=Saccharothrix violaceirubra TaxID=413306 RepID=A0A7W7TA90_9PSEU|nr:type II secretion system F family protein [Saccharothrix violaceirubra]MBB4968922.1 pilus assembly protein TadC [Saccharothrix violaceirubra]